MSFDWNNVSHQQILEQTGKQLKVMRKALGLSQQEVAHKTGINRMTVSNIETGKNISYDSLIRLLKAYGVLSRLDDLLEKPRLSPRDKFFNEHNK